MGVMTPIVQGFLLAALAVLAAIVIAGKGHGGR